MCTRIGCELVPGRKPLIRMIRKPSLNRLTRTGYRQRIPMKSNKAPLSRCARIPVRIPSCPAWRWQLSAAFALLALLLIDCVCAAEAKRGASERTRIGYRVVHGWPILPENSMLGHVTGVGVDSHDHVFVFHRGSHSITPWPTNQTSTSKEPLVMCFQGQTGKLIQSWGANAFVRPHGLRVDKDDNVWITDISLHQVMKFNHDGKLLLTVGERLTPGLDARHFDRPTDIAVAPDGSFYVSDGYGNNRVAKFSADGKFLFDWGRKGTQPGEFDLPHGISLDGQGRVYVADRSNSRIQVFNGDGTFVSEWKSAELGRPWAVTCGADGSVYAVDGGDINPWPPDRGHLLRLDQKGRILDKWSSYGNYDGQLFWGHCVAVGKNGAVYSGDIQGRRIQKFQKN